MTDLNEIDKKHLLLEMRENESRKQYLLAERDDILANLYLMRKYAPLAIQNILKESNSPYGVYDHNAAWFKKAFFILRREQRPLLASEIATAIGVYEPEFDRPKASFEIRQGLQRLSRSGKLQRFPTEKNKFRYELPAQLFDNEAVWLRKSLTLAGINTYPKTGSWLDKILFVLKQEGRPLSNLEIVNQLCHYEPDINRPLAVNTVAARLRLCHETHNFKRIERVKKAPLYFLPDPMYDQNARFIEKIKFILGQKDRWMTLVEIADIIQLYEPRRERPVLISGLGKLAAKAIEEGILKHVNKEHSFRKFALA